MDYTTDGAILDGNPTPEEIRETRLSAGLTQTQAARLIHSTLRTWQDHEAGKARMHPASWSLFRLKLKYPDIEEWLND